MTDQIIYRDTITGQTVTAEYAKAHPDTTVRETRRAGKWRRRAEAAEAKLEAVRELHPKLPELDTETGEPTGAHYCVRCQADEGDGLWPCQTGAILDGTEPR